MKLSQITIIEAVEVDFTGIDSDIVDRLSPFPSHYQQWAVKEINKGEHASSVVDAVEYYQIYIKDNRFQEILSKITPSPKNILTLSLSQIKDAQAENDEKYHQASKRELKKARKLNYTEKLVDTPNLKIVKITKKDNTDGAAKILSDLARASKWCVTDIQKADEYLSNGPLYLIHHNGERYLYAPENEELMDVTNRTWALSLEEYDLLSPHLPKIALHLKDIRHPYFMKEVIKSPRRAYEHAEDILKRRWPEAEPTIMKDPKPASYYAINVIKGRWPEAEPTIIKDHLAAMSYASYVLKDRWPEAEPTIAKNPMSAGFYAKNVIKGRWPEAEPIIMEDPYSASHYAATVLNGRWPEAEPFIIKDPVNSVYYARRVIGGRWPEAEPYIKKDPSNAVLYARDVIKGRWPEAEGIIRNSKEDADTYANIFGL